MIYLTKSLYRHRCSLALWGLALVSSGLAQASVVGLDTDSIVVDRQEVVSSSERETSGRFVAVPMMKATYFGIGGVVLQDTYLSPLSYGGYNLHFTAETAQYRYRGKGLGGILLGRGYLTEGAMSEANRWLSHRLLSVDYSLTDNPAGNASIHRLQGRWESARLYEIYRGKHSNLTIGGGYTVGVGGLYSTRNGNNPATLKLDASLAFAVGYNRYFNLLGHRLRLRLSSRTDLLGLQWSQQFGENYYELYSISQQFAHRFYLAHLGNQFGQQVRCSLDIPLFRRSMLSLNYRLQYRSWTINSLRNRQTDHTFSIGLVRYLSPVSSSHSSQLLPF